MSEQMPAGMTGRLLRVDLSQGKTWVQELSPQDCRDYLGGVGIGAKILYEEVGPEVQWNDPGNRLTMATGPLAGMPVWGSSAVCVVTRGPMTNGAVSTQANGFFGTNLKYSGYDGIVLQGIAKDWVYLYIHNDTVELRDARELLGKDTWETQDALQAETGYSGHQLSVYCSGVAGENQVRFAGIHGDYGHVASKNGCGAVLGAKKVKAVAIVRGNKPLAAADPQGLFTVADDIGNNLRTNPTTKTLYEYGTLPGVRNLNKLGVLPIRNYTTNVWPKGVDGDKWEAPMLREGFDHRGHQCSSCGMHHCHQQVIREGKNKGQIVDEPEYEGWSSGWAMGITDPQATAWLNTQMDRACVDCNEFGWLCGWVMECYEKGHLTKEQLGGLEMKWGDAEAANALLQMVVKREGIGDLLAEGVKRASEKIGGEAAKAAIYTAKGATPRGHDHRGRWEEMLDTALSSNGTYEAGAAVNPTELGLPARMNPFNPQDVVKVVSTMLGRRHFEDALGTCTFTTRTTLASLCTALSSATGWDYRMEEAIRFSRRTACLLRAFNVRCGIGPETEKPSVRYGSAPVDGPNAGTNIMDHWEEMVASWYEQVGYDRRTGNPKPELLKSLGLNDLAKDLWGKQA